MTRFNTSNALRAAIVMTAAAGLLWPSPAHAQNAGVAAAGGGATAGAPAGSNAGNATDGGTNSTIGGAGSTTAVGNATTGIGGNGTTNGANTANGTTGTGTSSSIMGAGAGAAGLSSPASAGTNGGIASTSGVNGLTGGGIPLTTSSTDVFSLQSSIALTFQSSSDLRIAETNLHRDQALVSVASDHYLPNVSASGTATHLDSPIVVPFGGTKIPVEPENTQAFDANATLPIDISGEVKATEDAAKLQVMADRFNLDRVRNALVLDAQTSYFNVLRAQHQVAVAQTALDDAQTQYKTAQTQFAGGIGQKIDVYRASTQVAQAQQALLQAQNAYALEQYDFNDVVGRKLDAAVAAQDVPGVTVGTTVPQNGQPAQVGAPDNSVHAFYAPPPAELNQINLMGDIDKARKTRPELRSDQVSVQAAAKQVTITQDQNRPTLSLSATGNYYPVTDFETPRHSLGVLSATLNVPIFDGNITRDKMRADRDNQKNAETLFESDETTVELQVRQAYLNLYTASNQIASANSALQQAIAARQLAQVRYSSGVGLYLEVTDAEAALTSAENSQVNSVYDYLIARAQYQNAIGAPDLNPTL
jgi:outer membrane protein TolC